jgi:ribosomal protein L37AE/L43A
MDIKSFVKDLQDRNNSTYYKAITLAETIIKGLYEEDNPQEYKKLRTALADLRCESQVDFDKCPKCKISMFDDNIEDLWCCPECDILIKKILLAFRMHNTIIILPTMKLKNINLFTSPTNIFVNGLIIFLPEKLQKILKMF